MFKILSFKCDACNFEEDRLTDVLTRFGDHDFTACPKCQHDVMRAQPSCCPVRTPMNSVSFIDGHPDRGDNGRHAATVKSNKLENELNDLGKNKRGAHKSPEYAAKKAEIADWSKYCNKMQEAGK